MTLLTCALTLPCSLADNQLQVNGCKAIAAVLDKTQITSLKCTSPCASHLAQRLSLTFAVDFVPRIHAC